MARLAIMGHETRGEEVIEILEMLGGINIHNLYGDDNFSYYIIEGEEIKGGVYMFGDESYSFFTLEEFLANFPYKVGDKVQYKGATSCGTVYIIERMKWANNHTDYEIRPLYDYNHTELVTLCAEDLQPYKEEDIEDVNRVVFECNTQCNEITNKIVDKEQETMEEKIKIDIPKGYEFVGVDNDAQQVVFKKIKQKYPKDFDECCCIFEAHRDAYFDYDGDKLYSNGYECELEYELLCLRKLIICRDAYRKIASEQMGLEKLWNPDWAKADERKYCIVNTEGNIVKWVQKTTNKILAFPTEEMRDTFYENFKDLIEECKELL